MNKILVINNKIVDNDNVIIKDNVIYLRKSGNYKIEYIDCDNINVNINIESNINVDLLEYSSNNKIKINNKYILNDNSLLNVYKFYYNYDLNENINIDLNGYNSKINYYFSSIGKNNESYKLNINHNHSNSSSNVINKLIAFDKANINCIINSNLEDGKTGCVLNQDTKIITFGDNNCKIEPNMFIEEDDVEARHASVIGKFNQDDLFYLLCRGIKYEEAIKLLVKGYILSNLKMDNEYRMYILNVINTNWR